MPPNEEAQGAWLLGRALEWQVTALEVALAAPLLAWRTGLALAGSWVAPVPAPPAAMPPAAAAPEAAAAEEVDHLA